MRNAKSLLTALMTIDAKIKSVGPNNVITQLDVKVIIWSALLDNVKITIISGKLAVKMTATAQVMLLSVIKDSAGVLDVTKALKPLELLKKQLPPKILLLLLFLLF